MKNWQGFLKKTFSLFLANLLSQTIFFCLVVMDETGISEPISIRERGLFHLCNPLAKFRDLRIAFFDCYRFHD